MTAVIRPATDADLDAFYGARPAVLASATVLAWAGEVDGVVRGVGGVAFHASGAVRGFLDVDDIGRRHAVTLHRAALRTLAEWRGRGHRRLNITIDRAIPRAEAWARRLGFEPLVDEEGVWTCRA